MFHFFDPSQDNAIATTSQLLRLLKAPVMHTTLRQTLQEHPDYPSLLSIMDSLKKWKIENMGIQVKTEQLSGFSTPFIAHIKEDHQDEFTVVQDINKEQITYYDPDQHKFITTSLSQFSQVFKGTVMLAEVLEEAGEPFYKQRRRQAQLQHLRVPLALLLAILLMILIFTNAFIREGISAVFPVLFTFLAFVGIIVTGLLLWYEVDRYNPVLQKICTGSKHTNCHAILHSKAAKLGSLISWSEIGFIYFAGGFLSLLLSGINENVLTLLAWMNVLVIPYVFFSVYYQWRVAKQWCTLCLTVQGLLLAELLVSLGGNLYANPLQGISPQMITLLIFSFVAPILIWSAIKPLWLQAREGQRNRTALLRLKHDPRIFEALLPKQKAVSLEDIADLGITLGNPAARHKLVKVCNPYCGPCAKAHLEIEKIMENNSDLTTQIIFTATNDEKDRRSQPAKHLMAIYEKGDANLMKRALDDWYNAPKKDYTEFTGKYPLNGELQQQGEKLKTMSEWCEKTGISFTPTFFIDGYQMPDIYNVEDLKYLVV